MTLYARNLKIANILIQISLLKICNKKTMLSASKYLYMFVYSNPKDSLYPPVMQSNRESPV